MSDSVASPDDPRRDFWRRPLGIFTLLLAILLIAAGLYLRPLIGDLLAPNQHANVVSIERQPSYRNPKAMAAAWSLPVARAYRRQPYEFQGNQSFCGPTSLADVTHSLGDVSSQRAVIVVSLLAARSV